MPQQQVYIIHGYGASPQHHWFPWLKQKLQQHGIQVTVPALPTPEHPIKEAWDATLKQAIGTPDQNTFFVAHSLGCIALLDYLRQLASQLEPHQHLHIGGLILVSGFSSHVPGYNLINPFIAHALDADTIIKMTDQRVVIASKDDPTVPFELTQKLSQDLQARFISVEHGGHFLGQDGFDELPMVYDELYHMLKQS